MLVVACSLLAVKSHEGLHDVGKKCREIRKPEKPGWNINPCRGNVQRHNDVSVWKHGGPVLSVVAVKEYPCSVRTSLNPL